MPEIKAIETLYKGYRFRSRLEARWAVFFDAAGIKWEYEKEGYVLSNGECYLPDFWLPDYFAFAEIKGTKPTEEEISKAALLAEGTDHPVFVFFGDGGLPIETWIKTSHKENVEFYFVFVYRLVSEMSAAWKKARGARFEFGESG